VAEMLAGIRIRADGLTFPRSLTDVLPLPAACKHWEVSGRNPVEIQRCRLSSKYRGKIPIYAG